MADWSKLVLCPECGAANPRDGIQCVKCRTNLHSAVERMESIRQERLARSRKGRQPQGRRDFKPVDELAVADLERSPVWQYDLDREGDHDETWVRPVKSLPVTDLSNRVVGTVARLACGEGVFCLLGAISLDDARCTRQFLGFTAFGKDEERFDLARYFDSDYNSHGPEALAKFLEKTVADVFPVVYDISKVASGLPDVVRGTLFAVPPERLSDEEIRSLAIGRKA
jgi:hypothetical protein